jgi:hypothetical protein
MRYKVWSQSELDDVAGRTPFDGGEGGVGTLWAGGEGGEGGDKKSPEGFGDDLRVSAPAGHPAA